MMTREELRKRYEQLLEERTDFKPTEIMLPPDCGARIKPKPTLDQLDSMGWGR